MLYIDLVGVPGMACYIEIRWSGGSARYGVLYIDLVGVPGMVCYIEIR